MRIGFAVVLAVAAWSPTTFAGTYVCIDGLGARTVQDHACGPSEQQKKMGSLRRDPIAGVVYAHWSHDVLVSSVNPDSLQDASLRRIR